jgi:hypothetical protein
VIVWMVATIGWLLVCCEGCGCCGGGEGYMVVAWVK